VGGDPLQGTLLAFSGFAVGFLARPLGGIVFGHLGDRYSRIQCLRVREIHYGDNGVKTSTGEWENFYSEIEGYKHEPGIRNVLRIQRYKRQNVPADASAYAYVLDMVVESERVGR
jgi:hypothetical protein